MEKQSMNKKRVNLLRLISELDNDLIILKELLEKHSLVNKKIKHLTPDEFDWTSLGYTIHNIYNLFENYFLRISKFFENNLDQSSWHKDLVNRMTLEIKSVRPRLFDQNLAIQIHELRGFRHIFRYIYQSELDVNKLKKLNIKVPKIIKEFTQSHKIFRKNIQKIIDLL